MKEWIAVLQERSMTYKRLWLLFLRQYYIWRTKRHIQLAKDCEEKRLLVLRRLYQEDMPERYVVPGRGKLRRFWECGS